MTITHCVLCLVAIMNVHISYYRADFLWQYSIQCSTQYAVYSIQCTMLFSQVGLFSSLHCLVYTIGLVQCILYNVLYNIDYTFSIRYIVSTVLCSDLYSRQLFVIQYVCSVYYIVQYIQYSVLCNIDHTFSIQYIVSTIVRSMQCSVQQAVVCYLICVVYSIQCSIFYIMYYTFQITLQYSVGYI